MKLNRTTRIALFAVVLGLTNSLHAAETVSFEYDALGRMKQVQVAGGVRSGVRQSFQYDPAGNRTGTQTLGPANPRNAEVAPQSLQVNSMGSAGGRLVLTVGNGNATGSVSLSINGLYADSVQVTNGQATARLIGLSPGVYTVTAVYSGDLNHDPKTTTFVVTVKDLSWLPSVLDLLM
jgi:YD repeat-containing protein